MRQLSLFPPHGSPKFQQHHYAAIAEVLSEVGRNGYPVAEFAKAEMDAPHAQELNHMLAELKANRLYEQRLAREKRAGFRRQDGGW